MSEEGYVQGGGLSGTGAFDCDLFVFFSTYGWLSPLYWRKIMARLLPIRLRPDAGFRIRMIRYTYESEVQDGALQIF